MVMYQEKTQREDTRTTNKVHRFVENDDLTSLLDEYKRDPVGVQQCFHQTNEEGYTPGDLAVMNENLEMTYAMWTMESFAPKSKYGDGFVESVHPDNQKTCKQYVYRGISECAPISGKIEGISQAWTLKEEDNSLASIGKGRKL